MPELPEVETVARELRPLIKGKTITKIEIVDKKLKIKNLKGRKIQDVYRIGKQVILELDRKEYLAIHLRMTGRLISVKAKSQKSLADFYYKTSINQKHIRFKLLLNKGEVHFVDPRRFGTVSLVNSVELKAIDPVSKDFTKSIFTELLSASSQPLKHWLMRQDKLVGIGNIYASEILFAAKIKPTRKTNSLTAAEIAKLYSSIKKILDKAIKHCGTTFSDFQTTTGEVGSFQRFLKVYGRENQKCYLCKAEIMKFVQQQRSTFYCIKCQK